MIDYDHDGFLAASRLIAALVEHGRTSDEYQQILRVTLYEYRLPSVIVALSDIACSWPDELMNPLSEFCQRVMGDLT